MTEKPMGGRELSGTFFVLEDDPPATRPRWFCHWDGDDAPGFDDVEDAVSWGLAHARSVVIRTLGTVFYWTGKRPTDWNPGDAEMREWPPGQSKRQQIDVDYAAAVQAADQQEAAYRAYEREREQWVRDHAPELTGSGPVHECLILQPGRTGAEIEFEELDLEGRICAARSPDDGRVAFGTTEEVIASVTGCPPDDPWLRAVCQALGRERIWDGSRRSTLDVNQGTGEMLHVTATSNRESIEQHGLDWRRMAASCGVAGSRVPELEAIFLCESREDVSFFTRMARTPVRCLGGRDRRSLVGKWPGRLGDPAAACAGRSRAPRGARHPRHSSAIGRPAHPPGASRCRRIAHLHPPSRSHRRRRCACSPGPTCSSSRDPYSG